MWPALIAAGASMLGNQGGGGGGGFNFQSQMPGARMGGIASGLWNIFGAKNPSDAANNYLQQGQGLLGGIEGGMNKYMDPFIQSGNRARPILEEQFNRNVNDPTSVMNQIGGGFQQSPGYNWTTSQMEGAANRANAAGGMLGSPAHQQAIAQAINGIANQDYYNYVDRGMDQYNRGLGGWQGMYNTGFNASNTMAQGLLQQLLAQAQMSQAQAQNAYEGVNTRNQQVGGGIGSIMGGLF